MTPERDHVTSDCRDDDLQKRLDLQDQLAKVAHRGVLDEGVRFLAKPFTRREMALKIREALGGRHRAF